jgi:hypothetical protein
MLVAKMNSKLWTVTLCEWNGAHTVLHFHVVSKAQIGLFCSIQVQKLSEQDFNYYRSRCPIEFSATHTCTMVSKNEYFITTYEYGSLQRKADLLVVMGMNGPLLHELSNSEHNVGLPPVVFQNLLGQLTAN